MRHSGSRALLDALFAAQSGLPIEWDPAGPVTWQSASDTSEGSESSEGSEHSEGSESSEGSEDKETKEVCESIMLAVARSYPAFAEFSEFAALGDRIQRIAVPSSRG